MGSFWAFTSLVIKPTNNTIVSVLYNLDIVYSTSKGLVFDYLNNNKFLSRDNLFNQKNDFVIVDEIDFVLIDEARTPIILSEVLDSDIESFKILQVLQKYKIPKKYIKYRLQIDWR